MVVLTLGLTVLVSSFSVTPLAQSVTPLAQSATPLAQTERSDNSAVRRKQAVTTSPKKLSTKRHIRRTKVYVQGDSLTVGSGPAIHRKLSRKFKRVQVDAQVGRHTSTGIARTQWSRSAKKARIWVMALGTNDAPSPSTIESHVRRSLKMAGRKRHVVWVTLVRPGGYGAVNQMLRKYAKKHPRLHLVNWARHVSSHRWHIAGDGVHATHAGYAARARLTSLRVTGVARRMYR